MKPHWTLLGLIYFSLAALAIPQSGEVVEEVLSETHPVIFAIDQNRAADVSHWLSAGHTPFARIKNKMKERLLDRAVSHGSVQVFEVLLRQISLNKKKERLSDSRGTPLLVTLAMLSAPRKSSAEKYESMIEACFKYSMIDVNEKDRAYIGEGRSALHQASANGNLKLVKLLLDKKALVNIKNSSGETPLHLAARGGHLEVVRYLISRGAKVSEKTFFTKATPLMAAAETGQADVIRFLMLHGANKEEKDTFGKTAPERYREFNRSSDQASSSQIATEPKKR